MFRVNLIVILQQFGGGVQESQSLRKEAALWSSGMAADTSVYFACSFHAYGLLCVGWLILIFVIVSNIFMLFLLQHQRNKHEKTHHRSATQIYLVQAVAQTYCSL